MSRLNPDQKALLEHAGRIERALGLAERKAADLREVRTAHMEALHRAGVSWAEIARAFKVSPQAARYATGHSQRQGRKPATDQED